MSRFKLDRSFKESASIYINELLKVLGIDENVLMEGKSEFAKTAMEDRIKSMDFVGIGKNRIIHVECESTLPSLTKIRDNYLIYAFDLYEYYKKPVVTYVLVMDLDKNMTISMEWGENSHYTIHFISFKEINGEEILNNIENKINNNQELDAEEMFVLKTLLYTSFESKPEELLMKSVKLINNPSLIMGRYEKARIKYMQQYMCGKLIKEQYQEKIMEEIKMGDTLYDIEIRKEGEKVANDTTKSIAKKMKELKIDTEKIHIATGLTQQEINTL